MPPPVFDDFGRLASGPFIDKWEARTGIAMALERIVLFMPPEEVISIVYC